MNVEEMIRDAIGKTAHLPMTLFGCKAVLVDDVVEFHIRSQADPGATHVYSVLGDHLHRKRTDYHAEVVMVGAGSTN